MVYGHRLQAPVSIVRSIGREVDRMERIHEVHESIQTGHRAEPYRLPLVTLSALLLAAQNINQSKIQSSSDAMPSVIAATALDSTPFAGADAVASSFFPAVVDPVSQVSDGRKFGSTESFTTSSNRNSRLSAAPSIATALPYGIALQSKTTALLCIRRHGRRAVLLSLGKGGADHKPPRRNPNSKIWC